MKKYNEYEKLRKITNFKEMLEQSVELYGERPAFNFKKKMYKKGENVEFYHITYKEFKEKIDSLGTALNLLGFKEDDRIALISKNRYEWLVSYYAVTTGNKIIVPFDKSLPDNEIISLAQRSEAKALIFEIKYLDVIRKIRDEKLSNIEKFICIDYEEDNDGILSYTKLLAKGKKAIEKGDKSLAETKIDSEKMSIMLYTSGTTSISKAVMLSQKNICENTLSLATALRFDTNDSILALLPFHHALPTIVNQVLIYVGASLEFCDGLKYIQQNLCEYKPTVFVCVPAIIEVLYRRILKTIEKSGKTKLVNSMIKLTGALNKIHINIKKKTFKDIHEALGGNIRLIVSAAAPIDPKILKDFNDFGFRAIQGYGLTETSPVLAIESDKAERRGSVGQPVANVEIRIDNKDENGIGEIVAKGPNVMLGYYQNEEANAESLINGEFHTGDLGYLDEDGFLFITGRKKNVIVQKNGKNIFPEELEILISHIPGVKENIVFGKPTQDDDLDISCKIVYDKEALKDIIGYISDKEVYNFMKEKIGDINKNMPSYKHIRDIIVTQEELIKTTTAKVKRHEEIKKIFAELNGEKYEEQNVEIKNNQSDDNKETVKDDNIKVDDSENKIDNEDKTNADK